MTSRLAGKVAVITGGSRGLGHAIAHLYGSEGARVVIASRSAADVADAVDRLRRDGIDASARPSTYRRTGQRCPRSTSYSARP